jgi:hypothetical protein
MIDLKSEALRRNYDAVLKSGMFFEWYPQLTGEWEKDSTTWAGLFNKAPEQNEDPSIKVEINKTPSFTEVWHEGAVTMGGKKYMFWLINPTGRDEEGREYEIEIRWWFKQVPVAIRSMGTDIINDFKQSLHDSATKPNN